MANNIRDSIQYDTAQKNHDSTKTLKQPALVASAEAGDMFQVAQNPSVWLTSAHLYKAGKTSSLNFSFISILFLDQLG